MKHARIFLSLLLSTTLIAGAVPSTAVFADEYYDEDDNSDDWVWDDENTDWDSAEEDYSEDDVEEDLNYVIAYFDENGGDIVGEEYDKIVYTGKAYGDLPTATREGFLFLGWFDKISGGKQVKADTICKAEEDVILYAHWKKVTTSIIAYFDENGGTIDNGDYDMLVYTGAAYGALPTASRTGFKFLGWYDKQDGGNQVTADTICNSKTDIVLYAHWKNDGGYTIDYHVDSGENSDSNESSYVEGKKDIPLDDATSDTQTFVGWYTDANYKSSIKSISAGTTGNINLYARFVTNPSFSKVTTKNNMVTLKWNKCENAVAYKIFQSTSATGGYKAVKTIKNATSVTLKKLKYNTGYFYKIAAVYSIDGSNLTTDKSGSSEAYCVKGKSGVGASLKPATPKNKITTVSKNMKYYYQLDRSWKYSTIQKNSSGFFVSSAMVLNAMGKSVDPNKLYKKMGGKSTAFNPVKIQKNYNVSVNKIDLTGNAKQKEQQIREALAKRPQGVIIRKNNKQVAVAYLDKSGNIKINDPSIKNGANLDISKSSFKKYTNIDFVTTIDKK